MRTDDQLERTGSFPGGFAYRFCHEGDDHVIVGVPVRPLPRAAVTPAELAVACGIARGLSNAEIAALRGTTVRTVANQVASILVKLGLGSRAQVALRLATANLAALGQV